MYKRQPIAKGMLQKEPATYRQRKSKTERAEVTAGQQVFLTAPCSSFQDIL